MGFLLLTKEEALRFWVMRQSAAMEKEKVMEWKHYTNRSSPKFLWCFCLYIFSQSIYHNPRELLTIGLGQSTFDFLLGRIQTEKKLGDQCPLAIFRKNPYVPVDQNATLATIQKWYWIIINWEM